MVGSQTRYCVPTFGYSVNTFSQTRGHLVITSSGYAVPLLPNQSYNQLRKPSLKKKPNQNDQKHPPEPQRNKKENDLFHTLPQPTKIAEVPGQVQNLHRVFEERRLQIGSTLSILKQEEQAIKDILEKNVNEQRHLNKNQQAIYDISRRLQSIHHEAGQLLKSAPSGVIVRNRLDYLHGVPWNSVKVNEHDIEWRTNERY